MNFLLWQAYLYEPLAVKLAARQDRFCGLVAQVSLRHPGFAQSGVASAELYEYGDRLGAILDEMETHLIFCYMPPISGPIVQGSDLSKLTLRRCRNFISGTDVVVQTGAGTVLREVDARANLMAELGVYQVRALQQKLYRLASGQ